MEFILTAQNLPFAVALAVMLVIAALEGALTLLGIGFSSVLDNLVPDGFGDVDLDGDLDLDVDTDLDVDADLDFDADGDLDAPGNIDPGAQVHGGGDLGEIGATSALSKLLGWLCVGKVPVLVLLVVALTTFGFAGLALQGLVSSIFGFLLPAWIAWLPAFAVALPTTRLIGTGLARLVPKDETSAVSRRSFVGRIATVTLGAARCGEPAQARVRDQYGRTHYVMVEPDGDGEVFETGSEVLLVTLVGASFRAIRNTSTAMVDGR